MEVENKVIEEVLATLDGMSQIEVGTEEHLKAAQATGALIDRLNETKKIEVELERQKNESKKAKDQKMVEFLKIGVNAGLVVGGWVLMTYINKDNQRFESNGGMFTTEGGKSSTRKLLGLMDRTKWF